MSEPLRPAGLPDEFHDDAERRYEAWKAAPARPTPSIPPKVYRRHYCLRRHQSYRTLARCIWPRAVWVTGQGPYATLAHCRHLSVMLHATLAEAEQSMATIRATGCGGACDGKHELVQLVSPAEATGEAPRPRWQQRRGRKR